MNDYYVFVLCDVVSADSAFLQIRASAGGGITFDSGTGDYSNQRNRQARRKS